MHKLVLFGIPHQSAALSGTSIIDHNFIWNLILILEHHLAGRNCGQPLRFLNTASPIDEED